ncbi:MAG: ATP-binding cassette domain-containing protein [Lachnospiraceae bacterium]|nr:ATP-binding cassette domain-containing protein [Lachnospiraceae bacterium]
MNEHLIKITNLNKYYGKKQVLKNINLEISNGMFGLLGKNGAGKTTLMKIIASLLAPTNGECFINGISIKKKKEVRKIIGYLPQEFSFYPNFSCYEMLDYFLLLEKIKNPKKR